MIMIEKIYGGADFAAAVFLLAGGIPAPAALIYALALVLALKGLMSFVPIPLYMPNFLMCGADIVSALLLIFSDVFSPARYAIIFVLLFKAFPPMIAGVLSK
jgi:hypothetical protein